MILSILSLASILQAEEMEWNVYSHNAYCTLAKGGLTQCCCHGVWKAIVWKVVNYFECVQWKWGLFSTKVDLVWHILEETLQSITYIRDSHKPQRRISICLITNLPSLSFISEPLEKWSVLRGEKSKGIVAFFSQLMLPPSVTGHTVDRASVFIVHLP